MNQVWDRKPQWNDIRIPFLAILITYLVLGITVLGFNRSPQQVIATIVLACLLDMVLHFVFNQKRMLFPLSAAITGASLSILVNYAHGVWYALIPVFFAIASKYLITFNGRHVFNPSLFGIVLGLLLSEGMISASPAYQWGGSLSMVAFIVTAALVIFVFRIKRTTLIISFLVFYFTALTARAWLTRWHMPMETWYMGALTSPAFYLFVFFMITDPVTSPKKRSGQVVMALIIVISDMILHQFQAYSTLFYAGFIYYALNFSWRHLVRLKAHNYSLPVLNKTLYRWATLFVVAITALAGYRAIALQNTTYTHDVHFVDINTELAGIASRPGKVLDSVDPKVQHIAKWLLSVGDAVAVNDVNNDGFPDIFLTNPMKKESDRSALYLNKGDFTFERIALPMMDEFNQRHELNGLPSGALWFDYDNDGDDDLLVLVSFGYPKLLKNMWQEEGRVNFIDISHAFSSRDYVVGVSVNALDIDNDAMLDILIGNTMSTYLKGYDQDILFNIFKLPDPEYPDDRRMLNIMHRTWHNADNGGENYVYLNTGKGLERYSSKAMGLYDHRWTIDIGTGDLNNDGMTDLYIANDFGPDEIYINEGDLKLRKISGKLVGTLGRDTYKGMNASLADFDNDGNLDIYVSNVHERLQAEGSMLWMNNGNIDSDGPGSFKDEAARRNALNEKRFGWGAAVGDLNLDGRLDIVQANGMVDDAYDNQYDSCQDYWYWNAKIALTGPDVHGYADSWADLRGRCIFPHEMNRVYLNQGDHFVDVAAESGLDKLDSARGVALTDLDNDGDLDVLITHQFAPLSMYRNDSTTQSWVGLMLTGNGKTCNRNAFGTKIILKSKSGNHQYREIQASNGFSSQSDSRQLFGIDNNDDTQTFDIYWCGNEAPQTVHLEAGSYHHVRQL